MTRKRRGSQSGPKVRHKHHSSLSDESSPNLARLVFFLQLIIFIECRPQSHLEAEHSTREQQVRHRMVETEENDRFDRQH